MMLCGGLDKKNECQPIVLYLSLSLDPGEDIDVRFDLEKERLWKIGTETLCDSVGRFSMMDIIRAFLEECADEVIGQVNIVKDRTAVYHGTDTDNVYHGTHPDTVYRGTDPDTVYQAADLKKGKKEVDYQDFCELKKYLESHFPEKGVRMKASRSLGLGINRMSRLFKRYTGTTIMAFVRERRMARAKLLLYTKNMSVGVVAEKVGYSDVKSFGRAYKRRYGVLPKTHKKKTIKPVKSLL